MKSHTKNVTIKDLKYVKNDCVNPLYHISSEGNEYFQEISKS